MADASAERGPQRDPAEDSSTAPVDDPEVPGLAGERTDLAWSRTMLAAAVLAATVLKRVWDQFDRVTPRVAVFSLVAAGAVVWGAAMQWAHRTARTTMAGRVTADPRGLLRVTVGTLVFAAVGLVLSVVPFPK